MMRKIQFEYQKGYGEHNKIKEVVEFDDDTTDEEIEKEFSNWAWQFIADYISWEEISEGEE